MREYCAFISSGYKIRIFTTITEITLGNRDEKGWEKNCMLFVHEYFFQYFLFLFDNSTVKHFWLNKIIQHKFSNILVGDKFKLIRRQIQVQKKMQSKSILSRLVLCVVSHYRFATRYINKWICLFCQCNSIFLFMWDKCDFIFQWKQFHNSLKLTFELDHFLKLSKISFFIFLL